jgi:hypothetical protein
VPAVVGDEIANRLDGDLGATTDRVAIQTTGIGAQLRQELVKSPMSCTWLSTVPERPSISSASSLRHLDVLVALLDGDSTFGKGIEQGGLSAVRPMTHTT